MFTLVTSAYVGSVVQLLVPSGGGAELRTFCVWVVSFTPNGEAYYVPPVARIVLAGFSAKVDADLFVAALGGASGCGTRG